MDKFTLLLILVGLLFTLIVLVLLYVWIGRSKKNSIDDASAPETFESLEAIIHTSSSTNKALTHAVDTILERFATIGDYSRYEVLIETICLHPNTDSKLVSRFEKSLRMANPKYKEKIQKALREGLTRRDKK